MPSLRPGGGGRRRSGPGLRHGDTANKSLPSSVRLGWSENSNLTPICHVTGQRILTDSVCNDSGAYSTGWLLALLPQFRLLFGEKKSGSLKLR